MSDVTIETIENLELPFSGGDSVHSGDRTGYDILEFLDWGGEATGVLNDQIINQRRWYTTYRDVYELPSGKLIEVIHDRASTEMQEDGGFTIDEVEPYEVTVTRYRRVQ